MTVTRNGALLANRAEPGATPDSGSRAGALSRGVKLAVAVALAASVTQLLDLAVLDARWLDMNTHASVFGAISLLALAWAVVVAVLLAASATNRGRAAVALPVLLAVLLALRLVHPVNVIFFALPCAAATFVLLWGKYDVDDSDARRLIRAGCVVLVGSYLVHAGGVLLSASGYGRHTWPSEARLLVSHSGELAGWVLVATGLAAVYATVRRTG